MKTNPTPTPTETVSDLCQTNNNIYLSNPTQLKCKNCGRFWYPSREPTPNCNKIPTTLPMSISEKYVRKEQDKLDKNTEELKRMKQVVFPTTPPVSKITESSGEKWVEQLQSLAPFTYSRVESFIRKLLSHSLQQAREEEREANYRKVREFIHNLLINAGSINGKVEISSHDLHVLSNDLLSTLKKEANHQGPAVE